MENIELYLSVAATIIGLLISTVTFLTKFLKNAKAKKVAQSILKISNDILPLIEEAENFTHYTGKEKKAYVITKVMQLVTKNKYKISEDMIGEKIDELVELTRNVNTNRSSKELSKLHE